MERPADDHRLELGMIDIRGNDGSSARHFAAHKLRRHPFADRHELHLRGDDAAPREAELRDSAAATQDGALETSRHFATETLVTFRKFLDVARQDPIAPHRWQAVEHVTALRA